jgi:hypothetical protein
MNELTLDYSAAETGVLPDSRTMLFRRLQIVPP